MRLKTILAVGVVAAIFSQVTTAQGAAPPPLWKVCLAGEGAGQCTAPYGGIGVDSDSGHVYVADRTERVDEFTAWGEFVKAWGWGVTDGRPEPEVCTSSTGCQRGIEGDGAGQFNGPAGVVVDGTGNIYVADEGNHRVEKFTPGGKFVLMFGGDVDKTTGADVCTAASGDVCGAGTTGTASGQFGAWRAGSLIAVGPGGTIYVGDAERVQVFDDDGNFAKSVPMPAGKLVQALAVDESGDIYATFFMPGGVEAESSEEDVWKYGPAGASEPLCSAAVANPRAIAVDSSGLYVVDGVGTASVEMHIRKFNSTCIEDPAFDFTDGFQRSHGIAVSSACGIPGVDVFVANYSGSASSEGIGFSPFLRAYGPHPDTSVCAPPVRPPTIETAYAASVDTENASIETTINPHFWEPPLTGTTFYVEYGTQKCTEGGCRSTPSQALAAGVVDEGVKGAAVTLVGLAPDTTYHYRVVAESGGGQTVGTEHTFRTFSFPLAAKTDCPNQEFRTALSLHLPDCRAYEMVSPVGKNGGDIETFHYVGHDLAASDGERVTYSSLTSFGEPQGAPLQSQYLATRSSEGWNTQSISPPRKLPGLLSPEAADQFKNFSPDLCQAWVLQDTALALAPGAPANVPNLYRRENCGASPSYELLTSVDPPGFEGEEETSYHVDMLGRSADGDDVVYRADAPLTSNACATERIFQLYEASSDGPLRLISVLPGNRPNCTHSSAGFAGQTVLNPEEFRRGSVYHAVSNNGENVFWSASESANPVVENAEAWMNSPKLYLRVHATQPPSPVSGGECTNPARACTYIVSEAAGSEFIAADPEGTRALYLLNGQLDEYAVEDQESKTLAKGVISVPGASSDLSMVYLISTEVLSGGQQNSAGSSARAGSPNLYLYDQASETFTFVATLGMDESRLDAHDVFSAPGAYQPYARTSRVTPDGLHIAFTSSEPLTGYDNHDAVTGVPDVEVYLYSAVADGAGRLTCVSCNPTNARPRGARYPYKVGGSESEMGSGLLPGWPDQFQPSQLLGPEGNYLFFESYDRLVPADTDGGKDLYEWREGGGEAECLEQGAESYSPPADGCITLITSGSQVAEARLIGADASGRDIFFLTGASLLSQDPGLIDVYDAREGGGIPSSMPPSPCDPDTEGSCQTRTGDVPSGQAPASASAGPGNPSPSGSRACPRHKVKRMKHGTYVCVPRRSRRDHRHRSHHRHRGHSKGKSKSAAHRGSN